MNNVIQLFSFIISFLFGIVFAFLNELNSSLIKKKKLYLKIIITFLFVVDVSLLYLIVIYKLNNGIMHVYFLIFIILGYIISYKKIKVLSKNVKRTVKMVNFKKK